MTLVNPDRLPGGSLDLLVYTMHFDPTGLLWLGTNAGGLSSFNPQTSVFRRFPSIREDRDSLWWVLAIHEEQHFLWLGTWSLGLLRFDKSSREISSTFSREIELEISESRITCITPDAIDSTILWLGTYGGGLKRYETQSGQYETFTQDEGLPDNTVYAILTDDSGNLWMSTNNGLCMFDPRTRRVKNYTVADGLQSNQFNLGASLKTSDGRMFFGGHKGLNSFRPEANPDPVGPGIVITGFKKSGTSVEYEKPLSSLHQVSLSHFENTVSFEFVGLHYKDPARNLYACILLGYDSTWRSLGTHRQAVYSNLLPGEYLFQVKAANSDGVWSEPATLAVSIAPPLWNTWPAHLGAGLIIGLVLLGWRRHVLRQAIEIERARKLEEQRVRAMLKEDVHDTFSGILSKIAATAKDLVVAQGPGEEASNEKLRRIAEYADSLLQGHASIQWEYDPHKDSLFDLLAQLKSYGETLFRSSDVKFQISGDMVTATSVRLTIEWRKHLLLLFYEAMNNAAKHATECRTVCLTLTLRDGTLEMCLHDDGKGFFETANGRNSGLSHMRDRATKLHGEMRIESGNDRGTRICFEGKLPFRRV